MNSKRLLIFAGCLCLDVALLAQNAPPSQGYLSPVLVTDLSEASVTPDAHPLSGGQVLGIGSWGPKHSFITPSVTVAETLDSNPLLVSNENGTYRGFTSLGGSLQWMQYIGRSAAIQYSGAVRYDTRASIQGLSQFTNAHGVGISKTAKFRSFDLLIVDEAQYSQGSSFGAAGMEGMDSSIFQSGQLGNLSGLQASSTSLRPDVLVDESILTGRAGRISNTALVEVDDRLSSRSTATLAGSYGLLHFDTSLLTDVNQASVIGGYNHALTASNTVALEGAFTRFGYQGSSDSVSTEYFSLLYARRISGRSSIEIGGGPQVTQLHGFLGDQTVASWQGRGTIRYRVRRMDLSAQAIRGVSGGAGVLNGATTDTGQGNLGLTISRNLSLSLNAGVSREQQLATSLRYDVQFAEVAANRSFGRSMNLFLSYDLQRQTTSAACTGPACGYAAVRNVFGIGAAWKHRPISVE